MATVNLGRIKPVFRGAYNNSTADVVDDIVTSGNETFIAIAATQDNATTDASKWTKLAAKGSDGTDVAAILANKEIAFKTNAGALDGIPIGTAGQFLKVNSGATGYEFGAVTAPIEFKVATNNTTTTATYTGTQSSWTDHITQAITTTITAPVICNADFQHSYESGSVNMAARFILTPASGSDIEGAAQQIACYGFGNNRAMGAHNMHTSFQNVAAGSYTVKLQARNDGDSGTTGYLNYFAGGSGTQGDTIYILYK